MKRCRQFFLLAVDRVPVCSWRTGTDFQRNRVGDSAAADASAARIADLEQAVADAKSSGDNAWMLISSALVLMMTGPGLALVLRRPGAKEECPVDDDAELRADGHRDPALGTGLATAWLLARETASSAACTTFSCAAWERIPTPIMPATIPLQTFMVYQLMFAIITPALITGAFAERMKFSAMAVFMVLWSLIVYAPMAHMVWGKGGLLNASLGGRFPCLDFAGGTVVHVTSGVSALVCALYLRPRLGYPKQPMPPHSVVLSFIGACLLWVGWFGFNAGSALSAGSLATSAFVATHFGAAAATLGWSAAEWLRNGKPSALGAISGAVAGLVAITPAAGFVSPMSPIVIGLAAGVFCYLMVTKVKNDVPLRRFARCLRRSRRGRDSGRAADRHLRFERGESDLQECAGTTRLPRD